MAGRRLGGQIRGLGLGAGQIEKIKQFLAIPHGPRMDVLGSLSRLFQDVPSAAGALHGLGAICASLDALAFLMNLSPSTKASHGGSIYYTGPVFEAMLSDAPEFGSVFGGGRYDGLVARFLGRNIPAVGAAIGVDRLLAAMVKLG